MWTITSEPEVQHDLNLPQDGVFCWDRDGHEKQALIERAALVNGVKYDLEQVDWRCKHTRKLTKVAEHPLAEPRFAYHGCAVNELKSLLDRHLIDQERPSDEFLEASRAELRTMWRELGSPRLSPLSSEELIATRPSNVRRRWQRVADQADTQDFSKKEALVKTFIKYEKYGLDVLSAGKPPRAIQARGPLFTLRLAKYLVPIEHRMWTWKPSWNHGLRVFAKGRNAAQRAEDLKKMELWENTKWVLVDHSKFDSRVHVEHLKLSHFSNKLYYSGQDRRFLKQLGRCQLKNRCITQGGIFYTCEGRRMSGDIDTAKGNSEINMCVLRWVTRGLRVAIYLDGDDSVVSCHADDVPMLVERLNTAQTGMKSTVEVVNHFHEVDFCQGKPIFTNGRWMLMRNPVKAISNMCVMMAEPLEGRRTRMASIGVGEMHASTGCPVVYPFAEMFASLGDYSRGFLEYRHKLNLGLKCNLPDDDAYATCAAAWGIMPHLARSW